jgi:hypothetical protein
VKLLALQSCASDLETLARREDKHAARIVLRLTRTLGFGAVLVVVGGALARRGGRFLHNRQILQSPNPSFLGHLAHPWGPPSLAPPGCGGYALITRTPRALIGCPLTALLTVRCTTSGQLKFINGSHWPARELGASAGL